ncbi:WXG100 family type VII secretion target [Gordonia sp. NPDC003425]
MAAFAVDLDQLEGVVARLGALETELAENLTHLDERATFVHATAWASSAAEAHAEAHRQWALAAKQFHLGLAEMRAAADRAHRAYVGAQSVNTRMLR